MNRIQIRKRIQKAGKQSYNNIEPKSLRWLAGELMALNEEYVLNHQGYDETHKTLHILKNGFSTVQINLIEKLMRGD